MRALVKRRRARYVLEHWSSPVTAGEGLSGPGVMPRAAHSFWAGGAGAETLPQRPAGPQGPGETALIREQTLTFCRGASNSNYLVSVVERSTELSNESATIAHV